jgi:hypothetical protein
MSKMTGCGLEGRGLTTGRDIDCFGRNYVQTLPASYPASIDGSAAGASS